MDEQRARELLEAERARVQRLLAETIRAGNEDRDSQADSLESEEGSTSLTAEGVDDAVTAEVRERLAALDRAEQRLVEGRFGRSVRSGKPIPDERLEVDPAAELTVEEALRGR